MYDVMRCPSAYCATSSGMDITSMRASAHPTSPDFVRTSAQSSRAGGVTGLVFASSTRLLVLDSSIRSGGTGGGAGNGSRNGAASFLDFFLDEAARCTATGFGAGGGLWAETRCPMTSTLTPSGIWKKL